MSFLLNRYTIGLAALLLGGFGLWLWGYRAAAEACDAAALRGQLAATERLLASLRADHAAAEALIARLTGERETIQSDLDAALEEIAQHVPDNVSCDPAPDVLRVLNRARTGADPVQPAG